MAHDPGPPNVFRHRSSRASENLCRRQDIVPHRGRRKRAGRGAGATLGLGYRATGAVGGVNAGSAPDGVGFRSGIRGRYGAVTVADVSADCGTAARRGARTGAPVRVQTDSEDPGRAVTFDHPRLPATVAAGRCRRSRHGPKTYDSSARTGPPGVRPGSSALAVGPRLFVDGNFIVLLHRAGAF